MSVTRWDVTPRNASLGPCATVQWIFFWETTAHRIASGAHAPFACPSLVLHRHYIQYILSILPPKRCRRAERGLRAVPLSAGGASAGGATHSGPLVGALVTTFLASMTLLHTHTLCIYNRNVDLVLIAVINAVCPHNNFLCFQVSGGWA